MRTAIIIGIGFVALALCYLIGRAMGKPPTAGAILGLQIFIGIWLVAAAVNMWIGVTQAGYSVAEELPIFLLIFGLPAIVAAFIWWRLRSSPSL